MSLQNTNQLIVSGWSDDAVFTLPLPSYADGAWHHVVATYVGSTKTVTVYLDGVAVGSPQVLTTALNTVLNSNGLAIGHDLNNGTTLLSGSLDEVAVYPVALSAAQVSAHFSASGGSRPTAPGAVTATAAANGASVSWTAATATVPAGQLPVTGYRVVAVAGGVSRPAVWVVGSATSAVLTGLVAGTAYTVQVTAVNSFGAGPGASSGSVTPTGAASTYVSTVLADGPGDFYRLGDTVDRRPRRIRRATAGDGVYLNVTVGQAGALVSDADKAAQLQNPCCSAAGSFSSRLAPGCRWVMLTGRRKCG